MQLKRDRRTNLL